MRKYSLSALVAAGLLAGGMTATSASAADLGGNCCADLEERVAELEATTARKGNRKVSLTVSGWVAEQVVWWDDGVESNVYVGGIGTTLASHVKFTGQATITPGWTAGYVLHLEGISNDPFLWDQDAGTRNTLVPFQNGTQRSLLNIDANAVNTLQSYWFIKSEHHGKVSVGLQSQASDNAAILVDGSGSLVPANWVMFDGSFFFMNVNGARSGLRWADLARCQTTQLGIGADCNGYPLNSVRYDSPTWHGFSFSSSWGEDDFWDAAVRYAGEWNGIKVAAVAAYSESTDENMILNPLGPALAGGPLVGGQNLVDSAYFQAGLYIQHVPSGLFVYGAYGDEDNDGSKNGIADHDNDHWYVKAGIRQRWSPLGHTVLYGEYAEHEDMFNTGGTLGGVLITASEIERYGLGIVQEVDAAAMSIWLKWRHHEAEATAGGVVTEFDDVDFIGMGALINF